MSVKLITVVVVALLGTSAASADTIYSDFGSGQGYQSGGYQLNSSSNPLAMGFTASSTGSVSEIDLAFLYESGPNAFTLGLATNNGGNLGTGLGTWSLSNVTIDVNNAVTKVTGITGVTLTAGNDYFLYVTPASSSADGVWLFTSDSTTGPIIQGSNRGTSILPLGAFDILSGTAAPVPGPVLGAGLPGLIMLGAGVLGWWRRRNGEAIAA
jgi:hypothetical protein